MAESKAEPHSLEGPGANRGTRLVQVVAQNGNVVLGDKSGIEIKSNAEMARYVRPGTTWFRERWFKSKE
jgi:hypothetical protein